MTHDLRPADIPSGYPEEFERDLKLRDDSVVWVRPVVPSDAPRLADEVAHADRETLYFRFFTPSLKIGPDRIRYLTELDYHARFALAAFDEDGRGAGIARYERTDNAGEAEVAVTVKPEWRRRGLASALLALVEEAAVARGFERLVALYLAENEGAEALLASCGFGSPTYDAGIATVTKPLPAVGDATPG